MTDRPLVAIPIRSFTDAKRRLEPALPPEARIRVTRAMAVRTAWIARDAGADVVIVAGSDAVATWAETAGFTSLLQPDDSGLDGAAAFGVRLGASRGVPTFVLHADLPCVTSAELRQVLAFSGPVIAPSHDGGTALIGGIGPEFPFAYGPGSFARHLHALPRASVIVSPGLAIDIDTPRDLRRASECASWLRHEAAG